MRSCFTSAQITNLGGRSYNEDRVLSCAAGDAACWVLADGLGGHSGGADASSLAAEAAIQSFLANPAVTPTAVQTHIEVANKAMSQAHLDTPSLARMRTTIVVLVADTTHAAWGHVGDSRLYCFRAGSVMQQTKDHSVPQNLVDAGEIPESAIRQHEDRGRLLRSLGEPNAARATLVSEPVPIFQGDAFLLCSDGFWDFVLELEMEIDLAKSSSPEDWLMLMEDRLQERVNGSHDNYSAIAILGDGLPMMFPAAESLHAEPLAAADSARKMRELFLPLTVYVMLPLLILLGGIRMVASDGWRSAWTHIFNHGTSNGSSHTK